MINSCQAGRNDWTCAQHRTVSCCLGTCQISWRLLMTSAMWNICCWSFAKHGDLGLVTAPYRNRFKLIGHSHCQRSVNRDVDHTSHHAVGHLCRRQSLFMVVTRFVPVRTTCFEHSKLQAGISSASCVSVYVHYPTAALGHRLDSFITHVYSLTALQTAGEKLHRCRCFK